MGVVWGVAAGLFLGTAGAVFLWPRGWWWLAGAAIAVSTVAIAPSWSDAKAGAAVNVVIARDRVGGVPPRRSASLRARYERDARAALAATPAAAATAVVTERDLAALPAPVQRYLRAERRRGSAARQHASACGCTDASAAVRRPAGCRSSSSRPPRSTRRCGSSTSTPRMLGVPVPGYHRFADGDAMMLVKALGLVPVADDSGAGDGALRDGDLPERPVPAGAGGAADASHPLGGRGRPAGARHLHARRPHHQRPRSSSTPTAAWRTSGRTTAARAEPGGTVAQGQRWSTPVRAVARVRPVHADGARRGPLARAGAAPTPTSNSTSMRCAYNVTTP